MVISNFLYILLIDELVSPRISDCMLEYGEAKRETKKERKIKERKWLD